MNHISQANAALIPRAQALRDSGMTTRQVAKEIGMSPFFVNKWTTGADDKAGTSQTVKDKCAMVFAMALRMQREGRLIL